MKNEIDKIQEKNLIPGMGEGGRGLKIAKAVYIINMRNFNLNF